MPTLKAFSLEYFVGSRTHENLYFPLMSEQGSLLERLTFGEGVSSGLVRRLLDANKQSLVHVDFGPHADLLHLLGQCPRLKSVAVRLPLSTQQLCLLKEATNLKTVEITGARGYGSLDPLYDVLKQSPSGMPSWELSLEADLWSLLFLCIQKPTLQKICRLKCIVRDLEELSDLIMQVYFLINIRELYLWVSPWHGQFPWDKLRGCSSRFDTLREVHVHSDKPLGEHGLQELREYLGGCRREIKLCTDHRCPDVFCWSPA